MARPKPMVLPLEVLNLKKKHQCPILPKVGLRSDTPLFFEVKTMLAFLWVRSDTNQSFKKKLQFSDVFKPKKGQKTAHIQLL